MGNINSQLIGAQFENRSSDYSPGVKGRVWYNTSTGKVMLDTGTTVVVLAAGTGIFPLVLGSSAQVTAQVASHSTWASIISAASDGDYILVLVGSWTESVSISKRLCIVGQGSGSVINGTLTFTNAADQSIVKQLKVNDNITLNSGADNIIFTDFIQATGKTAIDSGLNNFIQGIRL